MKNKILVLGLMFYLLAAHIVLAADIYVDQSLDEDITDGSYCVENRKNTGTDGNAFRSIQDALNAMVGGDDIYIRGGTYDVGFLELPKNEDRTETISGTPGDWCSMQSYTGEWAILDGSSSTSARGYVIGPCGHSDTQHGGLAEWKHRYWKFERLEIRGGNHGFGLWINNGPFIVRYCYIHDNLDPLGQSPDAGMWGGVAGSAWENSVIEYNYFKDNGSKGAANETHSAQICVYSDYKWDCTVCPEDMDNALRNNTIRYNYIEDTGNYSLRGVYHKGHQMFTPATGISEEIGGAGWEHKDKGDDVHHNIFKNIEWIVGGYQEFVQIHHNIGIDVGASDYGRLPGIHAILNETLATTGIAVYNNTLTNGGGIYGGWYEHSSPGKAGTDEANQPHLFWYNNLLDEPTASNDVPALSIAYWDPNYTHVYYNLLFFERNYLYRPAGQYDFKAGQGYKTTLDEFDLNSGHVNYKKSTSEGSDNLFQGTTGADQYIARASHSMGISTIGAGGRGEAHPYLQGVTIPSYVGATNPDDHAWVAGVLSLADIDILKNGESEDPAWVEGAEAPVIMISEKPDSVATETATVTGTAAAKAGRAITNVDITTGQGALTGTDDWTATLDLPAEGDHQFVLTATDDAGMSSAVSFTITRAPTPTAIIYVDNGDIEPGSGWDGEDGHAYLGSPGAGVGYSTIAQAVAHMSGGDDIYLRGGTYYEHSIWIPESTSGSGANWTTMQSYPGEWAVIDGQRSCDAIANAVIQNSAFGHEGTATYAHHWKFERLEITGGGLTGDPVATAAGIWWNHGPVIVRYCYIHDNLADNADENPAGFNGCSQRDVIIEYNYFKNNGSVNHEQENSRNICLTGNTRYVNFYYDKMYDTNWQVRNNIIRYNFIDTGGATGIATKSVQWLTPERHGDDFSAKGNGDKIHHNIIINAKAKAIYYQQDFVQIYKNIIKMHQDCRPEEAWGISIRQMRKPWPDIQHATIYNNDITGSVGSAIHNAYEGREVIAYAPNWEVGDTNVVKNYWYVYNNLINQCKKDYDRRNISIGSELDDIAEMAGVKITNNYFYRSDDEHDISLGAVFLRVLEYQAAYGALNYRKMSSEGVDNLYAGTTGADQYITRASHSMGASTIGDGGRGGAHPYLGGVTIPSYVGATNPDDYAWVEGVLSLKENNVLKNGSIEDPAWVEGALKPVVLLNEWPSIVTTDALTVTGTAIAKGGYTITGVELTGNGEISGVEEWEANLNLDIGENQFAVKVTDDNGQSTELFFTIVREAVTITVDTPDNQVVSSDVFEITGTALTSVVETISSVTCPGLDVTPADGAFDEHAEQWKTTATLSEGENAFIFTVTASGGATSDAAIRVVYDIPPPTLTFTTGNGETVTNASLIISGTASAEDPQRTVSSVSAPGLTVTGTTDWSTTATLTEGSNVFYFTVTDSAGETSERYMFTVTYEPITYDPPTIEITTRNNQTVTDASFVISGTASADERLSVAGVTSPGLEVSGTTDWRAGVTLAEGVNYYTFTVTDSAGKTAGATLTVTYAPPSSFPALTITTPNNQTVRAAAFSITGTASAPAGRTVDRVASPGLTVKGTTNWSTVVTLTKGVNHYTFTVTDSAGKTAGVILTVTYAPIVSLPALTLTTPNNQTVTDAAFHITGTASAPAGRTVVSVTSPGLTLEGTTNWRTDVRLAESVNHYTFTVTDSAGNTAEATLTVTYAPKTLPPTLILATEDKQTVTDALFHITGTASAPPGRTVVSVTSPGLTVEGTTSWHTDVTLSKGEKTYTFTVTDSEGETAAATLTVTYDDSSAPSGSSSGSGCFISSLMNE